MSDGSEQEHNTNRRYSDRVEAKEKVGYRVHRGYGITIQARGDGTEFLTVEKLKAKKKEKKTGEPPPAFVKRWSENNRVQQALERMRFGEFIQAKDAVVEAVLSGGKESRVDDRTCHDASTERKKASTRPSYLMHNVIERRMELKTQTIKAYDDAKETLRRTLTATEQDLLLRLVPYLIITIFDFVSVFIRFDCVKVLCDKRRGGVEKS